MKRIHVLVEGRVQGVFFRAHMQREARSHGITGWVRNLADGSVEAVLEGRETGLAAMLDWCRQGPPHASVRDVRTSEEPYTGDFKEFSIRY